MIKKTPYHHHFIRGTDLFQISHMTFGFRRVCPRTRDNFVMI